MKKLIIVTFALLLSTVVGFSQQYGHLNFGSLLSVMPETKAADATLEAYQIQLSKELEAKANAFSQEYGNFAKAVQNGTVAPQEQARKEQELRQKQQELLAMEQQIPYQVEQKRNELLSPIVDKAQKAIDQVAKERGYVLIFDTSIFNSVLYAGEAENVMAFVLAKLGL